MLRLSLICVVVPVSAAVDITIFNNCPFQVWPGIQGNPLPENGGFSLDAGEKKTVQVADGWSAGRVWARTQCDGDMNCDTGFCGNDEQCGGNGGQPPVSLAEFTLNGDGGQDYYDVSLVDGYNIPVLIEVVDATTIASGPVGGCDNDVNAECPLELAVDKDGNTVGCKSSCLAFDADQYCCRGGYGTPDTCNPDDWEVNSAQLFKDACPNAYSYAYDDGTSTYTSRGTDSPSAAYQVQFC